MKSYPKQSIDTHHQASIKLADEIISILESGDSKQIEAVLNKVRGYSDTSLESHFQHEERTIFAPLFKQHRKHLDLATQLLKEHGRMRLLGKTMQGENAVNSLREFAELLKSHTLIEDTELMPAIARLFSQQELQAIEDFVPPAL